MTVLLPSVIPDASLGSARVSGRHLVSVIAVTVSLPIRSGANAPSRAGRTRQVHGIWGGLTEEERNHQAPARKADAATASSG